MGIVIQRDLQLGYIPKQVKTCSIRKGVLMHENHDIFIKAIKTNSKIILIYYGGEEKLYVTKLVIPVYFRPSNSAWDTDIYYFWDSQARSHRLLILQFSQIKSMELSDESFAKADYMNSENDKDY